MYILEISCSPGGCRKGDYYVRSRINDIWNDLKKDLASDPYVLLWYGETIRLYEVTEDGIEQIDLHDYITVDWKGNIYDVDESGIVGYKFLERYDEDEHNDYDHEETVEEEHIDESLLLFETHDGDIHENHISFDGISLVIHLDLPKLYAVSDYPIPDETREENEWEFPQEEGYYNYE